MGLSRDVKAVIAMISISAGLMIAAPTLVVTAIEDGNDNVIERVSEDTREDAITKLNTMNELKEEAKTNWQAKKAEEIKETVKEEAKQIQRDAELVKAAEEKKQELHEEAKRISEEKIKAAEEAARKSAEKTKRLKKKLQQKREEKSSVKEEHLGDYTDYAIGSAGKSSWKSYEYGTHSDGSNLFYRTSDQHRLQDQAYVGRYGIFMVDGRYSVAVGSHYASKIGTKIDVYLANGNVLKCILGDQKADEDTDSTNSYHVVDGSYLEFIVSRSLNSSAKRAGTLGAIPEMSGPITKFRVYK